MKVLRKALWAAAIAVLAGILLVTGITCRGCSCEHRRTITDENGRVR
ncbi:MAG: hypothetical protein ACE15C_04580 [Phycisphaerae bacterium]